MSKRQEFNPLSQRIGRDQEMAESLQRAMSSLNYKHRSDLNPKWREWQNLLKIHIAAHKRQKGATNVDKIRLPVVPDDEEFSA